MYGFYCSEVLWKSNFCQSQRGLSATRNFKMKPVIVTGVGAFCGFFVCFVFKEMQHEHQVQCLRSPFTLHLLPIHCEDISTSTGLQMELVCVRKATNENKRTQGCNKLRNRNPGRLSLTSKNKKLFFL